MKIEMKYIINALLLLVLLTSCGSQSAPTPGGGAASPVPTDIKPIPTSVNSVTTLAATVTAPVGTVATPVPSNPNCNLAWSRLRVGMEAYLTWGDRANRVRSQPVKDPKNVIGYLYPGIVVSVIEGPVCADGYVYWKVMHSSIPGDYGWTAEGDGNNKHWLNPSHCAGTSLYLYHQAYVAPGVKGLRVYDSQGQDGTKIADISEPALLKIVDGPYCAKDALERELTYWKVESNAIPGGSGWVAEYGYEDDGSGKSVYVRYLNYYEDGLTAFPVPPTLASLLPAPQAASTFKLSDLGGLGKIAYVTNDWAWVVNADGTNPAELKNPLGKFDTPRALSWSPDGKRLVMLIGKKMFLLTADGMEAIELLGSKYFASPAWSPDGQYIAFASAGISVIQPNGSDLHLVGGSGPSCYYPDWSPMGTYILYTCYKNGNHIFLSAYNGSGAQSFDSMGYLAKWSPDGQYIAYADSEDGISIMDPKGNHAHTIVQEDTTFAWSPDGKSIALLDNDQIYLVTISDGKIRNLTGHNITLPFKDTYGWLSWSPDSKYITYAFRFLYDDGKIQEWKTSPIFVAEVSSGAHLQLIEQGTVPTWSPTKTSLIKQLPDCTSNWSRLKAGEQARVMGAVGDLPIRVRSTASKAASQIGEIYPGTLVRLIEGPVCADGLVFWKVESDAIKSGSGWTAEGDGKEYWLEPYKP